MTKIKFLTCGICSVLLMAVLALGTIPAQAQTQPPNVTPTPEGLDESDWGQIESSLSASAVPYHHQTYLKASNTGAGDIFGSSIAFSGDTLVIGAPYESSNAKGVNGNQANNSAPKAGAVYVFVRSGSGWSQQAYLKASNTNADDRFGTSVAISGDTIVVGAPGEDSNATGVNGNQTDNSAAWAGAAYVFTRNGTIWSQQAYLKASNTPSNGYDNDQFGMAVAISADTIVVGAPWEDSNAQGLNGDQTDNTGFDSGAAYIFTRYGTVWQQTVYVKSSDSYGDVDEGPHDFGGTLAISGATVVIGARGFYDKSGRIYVFVRSNGVWSEQAKLDGTPDVWYDVFGSSVAISGDTIVVGAVRQGDGVTNAGAAYVFTRSGTVWSQQAYLKASNPDTDDYFGSTVSIYANMIVVGAPGEASEATGVNGDENNNAREDSGAAYVFVRKGTTWSQLAYVKASNTDASDQFGSNVFVSKDMILVGANHESSNATGIGGNQADNSAAIAGAVYELTIPPLLTQTFASQATQDGWVLESASNSGVGGSMNNTSATLILGDDDADRAYRVILHFNTGTLPDTAVITRATLQLKRHSLVGSPPFSVPHNLGLDISNPRFGNGMALQLSDFEATPNVWLVLPDTPPVDSLYSFMLNYKGRPNINLIGSTQFRLRFLSGSNHDHTAAYIKFYSGNAQASANRPVLVVEYYIP